VAVGLRSLSPGLPAKSRSGKIGKKEPFPNFRFSVLRSVADVVVSSLVATSNSYCLLLS